MCIYIYVYDIYIYMYIYIRICSLYLLIVYGTNDQGLWRGLGHLYICSFDLGLPKFRLLGEVLHVHLLK